jgi:hypothetical protein
MQKEPVDKVTRRSIGFLSLGIAGWLACWGSPRQNVAPTEVGRAPAAQPASDTAPSEEHPAKLDARGELVAWLKSHVPHGGETVDEPSAPVRVVHVASAEDTYASIASAYVDVTDSYLTSDLEKAIRKENAIGAYAMQPKAGDRVTIPTIVASVPKSPEDGRLAWPDDHALRGLYVRGGMAQTSLYTAVLSRMAKRGMNLIVLDAKDYDGVLTYKSQVPLAVETGAIKGAPIRDMARTIRFAHSYGIRVAVRVSCFEDEFITKAKPNLSVQAKYKGPYKIGWMDPSNEDAQAYILALATEAIELGADEIELDYVRYPVLGIAGADFNLESRKLTKKKVIRDFVRKVHAMTQAHHVPLSLDIFGVVADGKPEDIDMLGQDPPMLAPECEALSPMVYPSHYHTGYQGFEIPGNHPEIVGIATRKLLAQLGKHNKTAVRPWIQAMDYKSPEYGPAYLAEECRSAERNGGLGWLMWNPGQTYTVAWTALPPIPSKPTEVAEGATNAAAKTNPNP